MSASFHPKQDLVVSASLDQSVRVWDISALKQKNANVGTGPGDEFLKFTQLNQEFFNSGDAIVKYVLDGHDRGVNFAVFHPKLDLIVSASDDRTVRTWKVSDQRAWAVDTFSGHTHNVSCAVFHEKKDMIISASEDKTLRFYDISKSQFIRSYKREFERFWILDVHPTQNLIAAGHDGGLIVFKLERERPAFQSVKNTLYYMKDKNLREVKSTKDTPSAILRKSWSGASRNIYFDPSMSFCILTSDHEGGTYELFEVKKSGSDEVQVRNPIRKGKALFAAFVGSQKYATLDPKDKKVFVHSTQSDRSKELNLTVGPVKRIFSAVTGRLLLTTDDKVHLYDLEQQKIVASVNAVGVKFAVWSEDNSKVALLGKHMITICDSKLDHLCSVLETIRIKSGAFDKDGVFLYTTLNHMKYCLPSGDYGTIKTLELPIYIAHVENNNVTIIDREGVVKVVHIDATEYRFKLALSQGRTGDIKKIIGEAKILGDSIIAYLQQKGFPEIALRFVEDEITKFNLALDCGDIKTASEVAQKLDKKECWNSLGLEALNQGDVNAVEKAYQRTKNIERLSFLYSTIGGIDNLKKMLKIANNRGDVMSRFHNSLFLGDVEERVKILQQVGQTALAYITAKNNGLTSMAEEIRKSLPEDFKEPEFDFKPSLFLPPVPILPGGNWPLLHTQEIDYGDIGGQAMTDSLLDENQFDAFGDGIEIPGMSNGQSQQTTKKPPQQVSEEVDENGEGISLDAFDLIDIPEDAQLPSMSASSFVAPNNGKSIVDQWPLNSHFPADHIAAGAFDSAIEILSKAVGIKNFAPLKENFLQIFAAANLLMPSSPNQPSISVPLQKGRNDNERTKDTTLPKLAIPSLAELQSKLKDALKACSNQQTIKEGLSMLREIMRQLLFIPILTKKDEREIKETLATCCEYVIAFRMELTRKDIQNSDVKKSAELSAYFTRCKLQNAHIMLGLNSAMAISFKLKNFVAAASFANRLTKLGPPEKVLRQAQYVIDEKQKNPTDEIALDYDDRNPFVVCNISLTPIYAGSDKICCSYCGASYLPKYDGELCTICEMGTIGKKSIGLYQYANAIKSTPTEEEEF